MPYPTPGVTRNWGQQLLDAIAADVTNAELASAVNATNVVTSLSAPGGGAGGAGAIVTVPSTAISVPASTRPVTLEFQGAFIQTAVGTGTTFLLLYETTGGGATILEWSQALLPNSTATALSSVPYPLRTFRLGSVASTRTFELRAYIFAVAGATPTGNVRNNAQQVTSLRALAG